MIYLENHIETFLDFDPTQEQQNLAIWASETFDYIRQKMLPETGPLTNLFGNRDSDLSYLQNFGEGIVWYVQEHTLGDIMRWASSYGWELDTGIIEARIIGAVIAADEDMDREDICRQTGLSQEEVACYLGERIRFDGEDDAWMYVYGLTRQAGTAELFGHGGIVFGAFLDDVYHRNGDSWDFNDLDRNWLALVEPWDCGCEECECEHC